MYSSSQVREMVCLVGYPVGVLCHRDAFRFVHCRWQPRSFRALALAILFRSRSVLLTVNPPARILKHQSSSIKRVLCGSFLVERNKYSLFFLIYLWKRSMYEGSRSCGKHAKYFAASLSDHLSSHPLRYSAIRLPRIE